MKLFGISLFVVGLNLLYFLEKVKKKVSQIENSIIQALKEKYKENNLKVGDVVYVYRQLTKSRSDLSSIKYYTEVNLWSGIAFPIGALIGFILNLTGSNEGLALMILFSSGVLFSISFIIMCHFYIKK